MSSRLSRRHWITTVSAAGSALSLSPSAFAAPKAEADEPFKLGVASYSLRKLSRPDAIKALKTLNVDYVNIKDVHLALTSTPEEIATARKQFEDAGIKIIGVGNINFSKADEAEMKRNFEYAKNLGAPVMVMAPSKEKLPAIEKFVKEYNIK
ncbi:MAG TPA: sugar phosphate isomerase/epimerase, partial [Bryobacteraceae bacterium]|nr:sugar phosphate isomerase/epimerase [Bryobacteraceae bacterium]